MGVLQSGLFNDQDHIDEVVTLTVQLVSTAVDDPGLQGELNNVSIAILLLTYNPNQTVYTLSHLG